MLSHMTEGFKKYVDLLQCILQNNFILIVTLDRLQKNVQHFIY